MALTTLNDDLLDLARAETGIAFSALQRFDLVALMRRLGEAQAEQADLVFDLVAPERMVCALAQPDQIAALADNPADNATRVHPCRGRGHCASGS